MNNPQKSIKKFLPKSLLLLNLSYGADNRGKNLKAYLVSGDGASHFHTFYP